jgi:hypothetical protein
MDKGSIGVTFYVSKARKKALLGMPTIDRRVGLI